MVNEDSNRDYLLRFVEATHSQLAKFAQESFGTEGRGVVLVEAPDLLPEGSLIVTSMVYHRLVDLRAIHADIEGSSRESATILLQMIETYDPFKQAVITVASGQRNPITIKMRLAEPFVEET
jgi:hypothetical protein